MNESSGESLFSKQVHPRIQAGLAFVGVLVFGGLGNMVGLENPKIASQFPWMIAAAFMLVFALFNSVFWIAAEKTGEYLSQSVVWYIILAVASGLFAYAASGITPNEAGSIKAIFIILTFGYVVFLAIMGTIKFLIQFLNKEQKTKLEGKKRIKRRRKRF